MLKQKSNCATKPKVTIGICVRNCEDYLKEAIESILEQDFPHELMKLVFVDDGSEDDTLSTIKEYISKIDIPAEVFHTSWKGLGHARNMVIANAEGNFILWVDGDMVIAKNFVRKLVEHMEQHPEVGITKGKQKAETGANMLGTLESFSRAAGRMVDYQSEKARTKALGTGGAIYRTEIFSHVKGFDENLRGYGEDWDLEMRVKSCGWPLCTIEADFFDYERHGMTWKNLWSRYSVRGYHTHYFLHKNKGLIKHYRMFPPAAFLAGILHARKLYKLAKQKKFFLLPLQYFFKNTAFYYGYIRSHLDSYAPKLGEQDFK